MVYLPENDPQKTETFRNQLTSHASVASVSFSSSLPLSTSQSWTDVYNPLKGDADKVGIERKSVDPMYLETFGISLLAGRNLREEDQVTVSDSLRVYNALLNEKAIQTLGFSSPEDAIGRVVITNGEQKATIVGVVQDFNNAPLQDEIHACMLFSDERWISYAALRLTDQQPIHQLAFVQEAWQQLYPDNFYRAMSMKKISSIGHYT